MAVKEYQVNTEQAVVKLDKDGKKVQRFRYGALVKLDDAWESTVRLLSLGALGKKGDPKLSLAGARAAAVVANGGSVESVDPEADPDVTDPDQGGDQSGQSAS